MTAGAITDDGGVVHGGRGPADGAVTVVAGVATGHMCGVLAGGGYAVMATVAGADDVRVIDVQHRHPGVRAMAVLADVGSLNMCNAFAGCIRPVVAADAIAAYVDMVESV
jgi:hypothetical protein